MISYAKGSLGKHLKNRQRPYQSVGGPFVLKVKPSGWFRIIHNADTISSNMAAMVAILKTGF